MANSKQSKANKQVTDDDLALLDQLGVDATPQKKSTLTAREQRIIAGFEEIERFKQEHGRAPQHGEDRDIFERLYAVRLEQMRHSDECTELLQPLDFGELLKVDANQKKTLAEDVSNEELLEALGVDSIQDDDITTLKHVKSSKEKQAAEEIAQREKCQDFDQYKERFAQVQQELKSGKRISRIIRKDAGFLKTDIKEGEFFILSGQTLYIDRVDDPIKAPNGQMDARLRVIYSNGTESNILLRSLQRAIYKDGSSRRITVPDFGPLFSDEVDEEDIDSGTIYILRSKSSNPFITENREVIHKIGVTGGDVKKRIANAKKEPTYLLADVELIETFKLSNINRKHLESLLHRFFSNARLDVAFKDRFGQEVEPREWFLVPLPVIEEAIGKLMDGSISDYQYDPDIAKIVKANHKAN
ncbi:MAG: GIY-YIG nuclease family protein [Verrucomicrobiales bacterium]|nr:GIY-YIG nuclease family protein [Verrucomicrobiales bacterium]